MPEAAPYTDNSWAARMAASVLSTYTPGKWKWAYEHGLFVKAVSALGAATGEASFGQLARKWVNHFITPKGDIRTYQVSEFNLDQINPGRLLFPLYRSTGSERYGRAIHLLGSQLQAQPRTPSGGFWHKKIYPYQMWLDGLYMAGPFYAEYALTFDKPDLLADMVRQFILVESHTRDPKTGLLYHGWDESKGQRWADPGTGCSPHFWGRSMGWYAMALVDVLDLLPEAHPDRPALIGILDRLARALVQVQDPETGMWYQIVDLAHRPGNYRETSVTAMLAYALARGVKKGYLASGYENAARQAYQGLLGNMVKIDPQGRLTLEGICSVGGLGGMPYRDGSFEYYISEPIAVNDFKGVGPFILAALEIETGKAEASL